MPSKASKVKVGVEVDVPEGDDEGVYREEFRRELAKKILNILLDKDIELAKQAVAERSCTRRAGRSRPNYT